MKAIFRPEAPPPFDDSPTSQTTRQDWYQEILKNPQKIKDKWSNEELRTSLSDMTAGECVWCGIRLEESWPVEHYFPKSSFPKLSYCWENLFPSCHSCNTGRKGRYKPELSAATPIPIDPALSAEPKEVHYRAKEFLPDVCERLLDPAVDSICEHLEFQPLEHQYKTVKGSTIGKCTIRLLFPNTEKEIAEKFKKISVLIGNYFKRETSKSGRDEFLQDLRNFAGYTFYIQAYAEFWSNLYPDQVP